jgi:hypothetical protein
MRGVVIRALSLAGMALAWVGPAGAQGVIKDPGAVGACLCQQQNMIALLDTLHERQQNYESSQKALASLDSELEARRARMDIYNDADVQAYKQLLQRHDDAAAAFAGEVTESYNAAIERYNQALAGYNGSCAGKSFDQTVYNSVQATLSCPKP